MRSTIFITLSFILFLPFSQAQIYGNQKIVTKKVGIDDFSTLVLNLNIDVDVIVSGEETYAEITTDENIIPFINLTPQDGKLDINQKKWIESSGIFKMVIYNPNLIEIYNDSWVNLSVKELNLETFTLYSEMSKISLEGYVKEAKIVSENSEIDLTSLRSEDLDASVTGKGRIMVSEDAAPIVKNKKGKRVMTRDEESTYLSSDEFINARFISLKIKNNKLKGFSAYVKGPKKNGNYFSYGLNFLPYQTKMERWSVGTKLYKVNNHGIKTLVYTVKESDENEIVKLWN